jgi:hypothetical protein
VHRGERRVRQVLDPATEVEERVDQGAHLVGAHVREQRHVGASAEHLSVAAQEESAEPVGLLDRIHRGEQVDDQLLSDEVQRRAVQRRRSQGAILLEARLRLGAHRRGR